MKPSEVILAIEQIGLKEQQPIFLWGAPGIGKSDTVRLVANNNKLKLIDKRLAQSDPTELKGYPWPDQTKKTMVFFRDDELPKSGKGILFLDEMNQAPQATQAAAFQLILDRRIGDYKLPDGWIVVAAGNRAQDRSIAHAMPAALANRFQHVDMEPDVDEWLVWARETGISDITRGYIRYRPNHLCVDKIEPGARAFPTPRSIAKADKIVTNKALSQSMQMQLLAGCVGEGVATEMIGYIQEAHNLPKIDMILLNPDKVPVPSSPATCHAIIAALESHSTPNNLGTVMRYVSRMDKEFEVVFMQVMAKRGDEYTETDVMTRWISDNRHVLI